MGSPESSEGEGCIHVGFQSTLPSFHGLNIPCDVYLNYNVIYTVPSDSLTGYDLVADFPTFDGDESAIITVTVNPVEVVKSTFDEVEHFENLAAAFEKGALNAKISEQLCVIMPTKVAEVACERMEAVLEIEYEAEAMYYQKLAAQDPVDSNFREIATPRKCTQFPPAQDRFTDAVDALVSNEKSQTYLLEAILTSINRASGAKEAGNDYWRRRQLDAAAFYSISLSEVMESEIRLQAVLSHAWTAAGYPSLIPAASDVHNAQLALYSAGFSPSEIQQLEQDEGFANANTVARLLKDREMQGRMKNQVIWLDEGGLPSVPEMKGIFDIAREQNARVVISGDTAQHHGVERGDALRILEQDGTMKTPQLLNYGGALILYC